MWGKINISLTINSLSATPAKEGRLPTSGYINVYSAEGGHGFARALMPRGYVCGKGHATEAMVGYRNDSGKGDGNCRLVQQ